jgi:hypothetical protein
LDRLGVDTTTANSLKQGALTFFTGSNKASDKILSYLGKDKPGKGIENIIKKYGEYEFLGSFTDDKALINALKTITTKFRFSDSKLIDGTSKESITFFTILFLMAAVTRYNNVRITGINNSVPLDNYISSLDNRIIDSKVLEKVGNIPGIVKIAPNMTVQDKTTVFNDCVALLGDSNHTVTSAFLKGTFLHWMFKYHLLNISENSNNRRNNTTKYFIDFSLLLKLSNVLAGAMLSGNFSPSSELKKAPPVAQQSATQQP